MQRLNAIEAVRVGAMGLVSEKGGKLAIKFTKDLERVAQGKQPKGDDNNLLSRESTRRKSVLAEAKERLRRQ